MPLRTVRHCPTLSYSISRPASREQFYYFAHELTDEETERSFEETCLIVLRNSALDPKNKRVVVSNYKGVFRAGGVGGWEEALRGGDRIHTADPHCCTEETNTTS